MNAEVASIASKIKVSRGSGNFFVYRDGKRLVGEDIFTKAEMKRQFELFMESAVIRRSEGLSTRTIDLGILFCDSDGFYHLITTETEKLPKEMLELMIKPLSERSKG